MRFSDYVHQMRIDEAKRPLEETTMEISEIAREVEYSSYNTFLKYFEKTPGQSLPIIKTNSKKSLIFRVYIFEFREIKKPINNCIIKYK